MPTYGPDQRASSRVVCPWCGCTPRDELRASLRVARGAQRVAMQILPHSRFSITIDIHSQVAAASITKRLATRHDAINQEQEANCCSLLLHVL
jgi:hypothetical protein